MKGVGITQPDAIETRHFSGFPGVYGPGIVVPLESTGMTKQEAEARIRAEKLPLVIVEPEKPKAAVKADEKGGEV